MDEMVKEFLCGGMKTVDKMLEAIDEMPAEFQKAIVCIFIDTWCAKIGEDLRCFYETALEVSTAVTDELGKQSWESYEENRKAWAEDEQ